jgi:uncharacterized protein (TIGR03000 family)
MFGKRVGSRLLPRLTMAMLALAAAIGLARAGPETAPSDRSDARPAKFILWVPADAEVWFNGVPTKQTGTRREFVTPPLDPGGDYSYRLRVRWNEGGLSGRTQPFPSLPAGRSLHARLQPPGRHGSPQLLLFSWGGRRAAAPPRPPRPRCTRTSLGRPPIPPAIMTCRP